MRGGGRNTGEDSGFRGGLCPSPPPPPPPVLPARGWLILRCWTTVLCLSWNTQARPSWDLPCSRILSGFQKWALASPGVSSFLFLWPYYGIWKFLGQGLHPSFSFDLCHNGTNAGSLIHCAGQGSNPRPRGFLTLGPASAQSPAAPSLRLHLWSPSRP